MLLILSETENIILCKYRRTVGMDISNDLVHAYTNENMHFTWNGPSLFIVGNTGMCNGNEYGGYYFRETRYLSHLRLRINNEDPFHCSNATIGHSTMESCYIFPPVPFNQAGGSGSGRSGVYNGILYRSCDLRFTSTVHPSEVAIQLAITNRWQKHLVCTLAWECDADFVALMDAAFGKIAPIAPVTVRTDHSGIFFTLAHDCLSLTTHIWYQPEDGWFWKDNRLQRSISLDRGDTFQHTLHIEAIDQTDCITIQKAKEREERLYTWNHAHTTLRASRSVPAVTITNDAINDVGACSLLEGRENEWLTPAAGIPLYHALFGRDALTAAWQIALFDQGTMILHTINRLSRFMGTHVDYYRDELPGRIIQQRRQFPAARLAQIPLDRNYADVASPFMFIIALAYYYSCTNDNAAVRKHWPSCCRIIQWAQRYGDRDGDGYIEYKTTSPDGPKNQGWKDSDNAIVDEYGYQVEPPLATCEVQGYYYAALQCMAFFALKLGKLRKALSFYRHSINLKKQFNRDFWVQNGGFIALGLTKDKKQIRSRTSNMGHCLAAGIIGNDKIHSVVQSLFAPDMFSGWGIRTLSADNPAYNPLSYHLGSVWPVENATIAFGLRRFGFIDETVQLSQALYECAALWRQARIPECIGGYSRTSYSNPGVYPRANVLQLWNASGNALLMQSLLGMVPVAPLRVLLVDPHLPSWLPEVIVENLRIGNARVSLQFFRTPSGKSRVKLLQKEGSIHIVRQPSPNALNASFKKRCFDFARSLLPMRYRFS